MSDPYACQTWSAASLAFDSPGLVRADVEAAIRYDLKERHPRLSLVAERADGSVVLVLLLDARDGRMFPGAVPVGGDPQIAIWLATAPGDPDAIVTYDHIYQGAPPLESLRYDRHFGIRDFTVAGASAKFAALERAFHDRSEAERRQAR